MDNQLTILNGLQNYFGIYLSNSVSNYEMPFVEVDENLKIIENSLKKEFGNKEIALKMSIDPQKYRRYYNGTYSSIVSDSVSKIKHEGFEGVNLVNLAKNIYDGVNKNLAKTILIKYNQNLLNIFEAVNKVKQEIGNIIISEHISEIESYKMFYEDLQEDIEDIMTTPTRRLAYLNKIIDNKTDVYKNFDFLLNILNHIVNTTNNCYQYTPTEDELIHILLKLGFLIKLNLNNCIYEYILTGDFTKSSKEKIMNRCKKMEKALLAVLESLKSKFNSIYSNFNLFISNSYSNGFFVKNCLNNFDKNILLLDYSELKELDNNITQNLKNVKLIFKDTKYQDKDF